MTHVEKILSAKGRKHPHCNAKIETVFINILRTWFIKKEIALSNYPFFVRLGYV